MTERKKFVYTIKDLPLTPIVEDQGISTRFLLSDNIMISFIENPPGATFPIHQHECEQIMIMTEGSEAHEVNGEIIMMKAGDVAVHPSNVPHGGKTETGMKAIDIFAPHRDAHLEKMKQYGTMPNPDGTYPAKNNIKE
nr:cupin domain-containing protein [uncultured Cohaesibacter sp.]